MRTISPHCPYDIRRPLMTQRWAEVSFAHWRVDPDVVRATLPAGLEPDLFDSWAWISLVGFEMRELKVAGRLGVPSTENFSEFNVRTYVRGPMGPGVWFASLDVDALLAVIGARAGFALPYCVAAVEHSRARDTVSWDVRRRWPQTGRAALGFEVGDALEAPDSLDTWLTARWALYAATRSGRLVWAPVAHEPWPLQHAVCRPESTTLADVAHLSVSGPPDRAHYASAVDVSVGWPRFLEFGRAEALTMYFDDDCGLCQACVTWLRARTDRRVTYIPASALDEGSPLRHTLETAVVCDDGRQVRSGVDAVAVALSRASRPWRWAGTVMMLPGVRQLAGVVYRLVARNRARISRRLGLRACTLDRASSWTDGCGEPMSR